MKLTKKILMKENPYYLFSKKINYNKTMNFNYTFKDSLNNEDNSFNKTTQNNRLINNFKNNSVIHSASKSLKTVALNSKLYSNYINFYSTITQKNSFKIPRMINYPILKNKEFISIKLQPLLIKDSNKEKVSFSNETSNSIFLSYMKEIKPIKKIILKKPYGFKYGKTKIRFDRLKTEESFTAEKYFGELCEKNLFESEFMDRTEIKKIDMNNCYEEKQKNFKFFCEYISILDDLENIFTEENFYKNISFNGRTAIKNKNIEFNLNIYSLCFKFFHLSDNKTNKKESQKLYFPFILLPLFYLLDFTSFKVLLSEIIIFNKTNNRFEYIKENLLINIVKKYLDYISNSLKNKNGYLDDITYNKKETIFSLIYDWIVTTHSLNEGEERKNNDKKPNNNFNNNYKCFKLKIVLPKIKFSIDNLKIKISKFLNKHIIAYLLKNKFKKWENYIFFDLFSTKKFKIIINLIMLNKYYQIPLKKIKLNKIYKVQNKYYEFFLTQIDQNYSIYYTFIPLTILIIFGEKDKKFQKIILSLKESITLIKNEKNCGMVNTLFKCMFLDRKNNRIFFKLELFEDYKNEINKVIKEENKKNNDDINSDNIKKVQTLNSSFREKRKDKMQTRYKDKIYEIFLLDCSFHKINITSSNSEDKYYIVPQNILIDILNLKNINKLFNTNYTNIPLMAKYIGENSQSILSAEESNYASEEKKMIDKSDIGDDKHKKAEYNDGLPNEILEKANSTNQNAFNKLQTFNIFQSKNMVNKEAKKTKNEEKLNDENKNIKVEKRLTNKYVFPKEIFIASSEKRRVSITNLNDLNQIRSDNINRDIIKKKTFILKKYN